MLFIYLVYTLFILSLPDRLPLLLRLIFWMLLVSLNAVQVLHAKDLPDTIRFVDSERMWPFVFRGNDGRIQGVMPESIRQVFSGVDVETHISLVPDARTITEVLNGHADATSVFLFRNLTIDDYPDVLTVCPEPIMTLSIHAIWHKDMAMNPDAVYELNQYRVGILNTARGFMQKAGVPFEERIKFQTIDSMMKSLLARRVDGIVMNYRHAELLASTLTSESSIEKGQFIMDLHIHLAVTGSWIASHNMADTICQRINTLKEQGEFQRIIDKYLWPEKRVKPNSINQKNSR